MDVVNELRAAFTERNDLDGSQQILSWYFELSRKGDRLIEWRQYSDFLLLSRATSLGYASFGSATDSFHGSDGRPAKFRPIKGMKP